MSLLSKLTGADREQREREERERQARVSMMHRSTAVTFDAERGWVERGSEEIEAARVETHLKKREAERAAELQDRAVDDARRREHQAARDADTNRMLPPHLRR